MAHLALPGTRLFYEHGGHGNPPLVFVHGVVCAHDDWRAQVDFFRPRHRAVACDLRGHGASTGDPARCDIETYGADVAALLRALDLPPAVLVGHSMGARVGLQAAADAPQRAAGLVLVEGSRVGTEDPQAAEQAVRRRIEAVGYPAFLRGVFADMFPEGAIPPSKSASSAARWRCPRPPAPPCSRGSSGGMLGPWTRPRPKSPCRCWSSRAPTSIPSGSGFPWRPGPARRGWSRSGKPCPPRRSTSWAAPGTT
jgi:pimeloyl-ACP methyl ester carboxylesterase